MITIHDVEQGSEAWLKLRADLYTGHNAHKLLSHSDSFKIVDGKKSAYALNEITGFKGNFWTKRGHILEAKAIALYEAIRQTTVPRPGFVTNSLFPGCGYSPDGLPLDRTIESKSFSIDKHLKLFSGNIPYEIMSQVQFGMLICEKLLCDLLIYNPEFAKREIDGVPNPIYDPQKAFKIIPIKANRNVLNNFRDKLRIKEAVYG